jgi:hypothetical protein
MILFRLFVIAFNVVVVTYLIYRLLQVIKWPGRQSKKGVIIAAGILLLLVPFAMFFKVMPASMQYFLLYPVAVSLFLYLIRNTD